MSKKIVILGAQESGVGAAVLAQKQGFRTFVSDFSKIQPRYKALLERHNIRYEEGGHTEEEVLSADEIIKSPGIPDTAPMMQKVLSKGIHVISEIEFAGRYTNANMVCITGSNGKTTTTSLIYHIFQKAGLSVGLAGNIGRSLALQVAEDDKENYVIELSSFQLDNMYDFRANTAILLNITPDHLDRYGNEMQNYVNAKMRIIRNQQPSDKFIYWAEDPVVTREVPKYDIQAELLRFSFHDIPEADARLVGSCLSVLKPRKFDIPQSDLALSGRHNIYNQGAACLAALANGISDEVLKEALSDFQGVEHRLEKAGTYHGIHFINDSKATNVDACYFALESMTTPTVLILGGKDKGNDYAEIRPLVREKCRALVYLGADNGKLHDNFDDLALPVADTHSMRDCLEACTKFAKEGDTVLLSPCCASFDLFHNMEERGCQFKALAKEWGEK